jgi:hypothetical protein
MDPEFTLKKMLDELDGVMLKLSIAKLAIKRRDILARIREEVLPNFVGHSCAHMHASKMLDGMRNTINLWLRRKGYDDILTDGHYYLDMCLDNGQKVKQVTIFMGIRGESYELLQS